MKGQFFISGIVVIAVILIVSMNYANSAEELRIELGNDLAFDNYKNTYERAVPDDWEFIDYENRTKIGVCVSDPEDEEITNTSVQFTGGVGEPSKCSYFKTSSSIIINVSTNAGTCWLFVIPDTLPNYDSLNCTEFYVYYGTDAITNTATSDGNVNGTKFHYESIETSPGTHLLSNYRGKNIFVEEGVMDVDGNYTVIYKSDIIDYTGEL